MARKVHKDLKKLLDLIDSTPGFTHHPARNGHILVDKDGRRVCVLAGTPSDWRSWKNSIADLRRAGLKIPH